MHVFVVHWRLQAEILSGVKRTLLRRVLTAVMSVVLGQMLPLSLIWLLPMVKCMCQRFFGAIGRKDTEIRRFLLACDCGDWNGDIGHGHAIGLA
jgi:hypothetical protein